MSRTRLAYFIFGIVAGSVFVYFILIKGKKFPAWLPADRVKEQIKGSKVVLSPKATCMLKCIGVPQEEVYTLITETGDVVFSKSETRRKDFPIYHIEGLVSGKSIVVLTQSNSKTQETTIQSIDIKEKSQLQVCNCDSLK